MGAQDAHPTRNIQFQIMQTRFGLAYYSTKKQHNNFGGGLGDATVRSFVEGNLPHKLHPIGGLGENPPILLP
ncbi:hypothetical protein FDUTEX481_08838 [Tolypothrix sp. PCC 7601]|nr:hypothetical protein FDUTEX481_08838 [Tolypothrix sp. PCC 7601]